MPSTTTDRRAARWSPDSPLLRGLLDDASPFPPAALPLAEAVAAHRRHRAAGYAPAVGPLLVAASGVADLVAVLEAGDGEVGAVEAAPAAPDVLDVVLVARPGADPAMLMA